MATMKLAIIMPSRGLIFSETIEEVLREVRSLDCEWDIFFSHCVPIPECFNNPTDEALAGQYTHLWFVEEDMILPQGILKELLAVGTPVVTADYPVNGGMCITYNDKGDVMYAGTGCLLVKREVFDRLERPIWDTTHKYGPDSRLLGIRAGYELEDIYGQHDIHFYMTIRGLGIPIGVAKSLCGQRRVVEYGQRETNDGFHVIGHL